MRFLKSVIEGTTLAVIYRVTRDELRFAGQKFEATPFGYRFAGQLKMQDGSFEPEERAIIQQYLASADVFVDIGADIGYFTCLACSMGRHVIAVEPHPGNLRYLYANLQVNGWKDGVEIYPVGLADRPGLATFYGAGTGASLVHGWAGVSSSFQQTIPLSTLDILLGDRFRGKQIVIKMDVEGAEYAALLGASNILQAVPRPTWLVEITLSEHRQGELNPHFLDTFEIFWSFGYKARAVGQHSRDISHCEIEEYANTGIKPDWATGNYLFYNESS